MSMSWRSVYNLALYCASPLVAAYVAWHARRGGRMASSWKARLFPLSALPPDASAVPARGRVLIHAASMGEAAGVLPLIRALSERGVEVWTSSLSESGRDRFVSSGLVPARRACQLPLDYPFLVGPWLEAIRPDVLVVAETEFWPNLFHCAAERGVPIVVVNGRVSPAAFRRYLLFRGLYSETLSLVRRFVVQGEEDARRLSTIGADADRIVVGGDMKFDQIFMNLRSASAGGVASAFEIGRDTAVVVAGSTHPGENRLVCRAFRRLLDDGMDVFLMLAPRHLHALDDAEAALDEYGLEWARRSTAERWSLPGGRRALLIDTYGELAALYRLADLCFVGGSLVAGVGGHSPFEPAVFGVPVVVGPHAFNFSRELSRMKECGAAFEVRDAGELAAVWASLLGDERLRGEASCRCLEYVESRRGALRVCLEALEGLLPPGDGR